LFITAVPLTTNLDLDIWLLDGNINRLAEQDANLTGEPETIEYVLPGDGQYIILVRDFFGESGRYEISLRANEVAAPDDAGTLTYGAEQASTLQPNQSVAWEFTAADGDVINIELIPADSNADLVLLLYDPAGNPVWSVDAAQAGAPEQINAYPIMGDGVWRIVVKEFYGEVTGYTLRLNDN